MMYRLFRYYKVIPRAVKSICGERKWFMDFALRVRQNCLTKNFGEMKNNYVFFVMKIF